MTKRNKLCNKVLAGRIRKGSARASIVASLAVLFFATSFLLLAADLTERENGERETSADGKTLGDCPGGSDHMNNDRRSSPNDARRVAHADAQCGETGQESLHNDVPRQPFGKITMLPGFSAEEVYRVPSDSQGSWVSLTVDDKGRLITSDQYGKLYRLTACADDGHAIRPVVEPIPLEIGMAQGLCYVDGRLYAVVNSSGDSDEMKSGLYRISDTDQDDRFDKVELLREFAGSGEHGPHAVVLSPDRKSLYVCAGNHTDLTPIEDSRVPRNWKEDLLLPRMWDARGHARGRLAPGGWIVKTDFDGKHFELVGIGLRNAYDIAFNPAGELFTADADMEWDIGSPWYRPTRVCHVTSGAEFGWRSGTGKWPPYYPDSLPAVVDIGPGSPTGVVFGTDARFPAKYQQALYVCDWSYGVIYAVHLSPKGASYTGKLERFAAAAPLPATDIVVNPVDGALYFTTGGRKAQSSLYRVTYVGNEPTAPATSSAREAVPTPAICERRQLEALQHSGADRAIDQAWPHLGDHDRFIRFAARIAIEHQPVAQWQEKALAEEDVTRSIYAMIALARCGERECLPNILNRLNRIEWDTLTEPQRLDLLRAYELAMSRMGRPDTAIADQVLARLNPHYPSGSESVNRELSRILVFLAAPEVVPRTLQLLHKALTQQEQIQYVFALRTCRAPWTLDQRREYLAWFHQAMRHHGGMSFSGYLRNIRHEFIKSLTKTERKELAKEIVDEPTQGDAVTDAPRRDKVKEWTVDDLLPEVDRLASGRDFDRGKKMFAVAQCYKCHRVRGEGETIGPDLTAVGNRFGSRDLLEAIIEPDKVISDQYRQTEFLVNGKIITGRVVNVKANNIDVSPNMLDQSMLITIPTDDIDLQMPSPKSVMPQALLDTLTKEEILDLVAFLRAGGDPTSVLFRK